VKVSFNFDPFKSDETMDGKHRFLIRLANQMKKDGIKINSSKPDIHIFLPRGKRNKRARINVQRVDGLIMNTRWNYKVKNRKIKESIDKSGALIYQGRFCEQAYRKFLGIDYKNFAIIPNGAPPDEFIGRRPKNFFLANSKWRPHKRLKMIIKCFLTSLDKGLDADLIVTGKPDYNYKHPRIRYVGWKSRKELKKLLSKAIASMHLTWLDWCPNSMVEAIVAQCPVIYTKSGGHHEIAKDSGIGIKDTYWKWDLIDLYNPPRLNCNEVADAMLRLKNENIEYPINKRLHIENVAYEYIKYFEKLLK
jgi:glycosyltransferase involved in cell wall biosynthesis